MNNYIGIIEDKSIIKAYAWYSYLTKSKIILFGEKNTGLKTFLKKNIVFKNDIIATYNRKWFEIQKHIVCDSDYLDKLKIETNWLLKFQSKVHRSSKIINFYKHHLSDIEYKILRDKVLADKSEETYCFLLPRLHSYKILAKCYLKEDEYKFSWVLMILFILFGIIKFSGSMIKLLIIKPVFVKKQNGTETRTVDYQRFIYFQHQHSSKFRS